jgi:hypothetical protein
MFEAQVEDNSHRFDFKTHKEKEMLAFRKLFLALVLVTLTVAVSNAQIVPAFQCIANAGVPPIVRAEGIAELIGDLVLNCNNGTPTADGLIVPKVNVQIFLNTNVTSKLLDASSGSEALLMIDEPGATPSPATDQLICGHLSLCDVRGFATNPSLVYRPHTEVIARTPVNMWQGRQQGANSLVWLGVSIDAPGTTTTRIIRVTNVRANANQLGTSSTLVPTQIVMFVSITGSTSVPVNNPQQTVAWIQQGLTFGMRRMADDSSSARSLTQCSSHNGDLYGDSTNTGSCPTMRLRFTEMFATAWKTRFSGNGQLAGPDQNQPGSIYNSSEMGFFTNSNTGWGTLAGIGQTSSGAANQGTRLRVAFNNVPAGVRIFVSLRAFDTPSTSVDTYDAATNNAVLVNVASNGSGLYTPIPKVTNTSATSTSSDCKDNLGKDLEIAEVPIFGGSGVATWEVVATNPLAIQTMDFGLVAAWKANTASNLPGLGTITASGSFAPLSTVVTASQIESVPRFADTSSAKNAVTINQCVTNLLFPFVSNQGGFNTGMAISNTTKDPYGNATEAGTCTLNYYGDTNGGAPPPAQTSGVVPAGDYLAFDLLSGGKFGVTPTPGFQGYIIAQCKFRRGHGYAFISDTSMARVANGYLALILDDHSKRDGISTSESLGN